MVSAQCLPLPVVYTHPLPALGGTSVRRLLILFCKDLRTSVPHYVEFGLNADNFAQGLICATPLTTTFWLVSKGTGDQCVAVLSVKFRTNLHCETKELAKVTRLGSLARPYVVTLDTIYWHLSIGTILLIRVVIIQLIGNICYYLLQFSHTVAS